ncbi:hypothetical protein PVNG_06011 [Plasmodium vivax North Korean]|uniref:Uncharacterized protein n=1 Tax=Plasmodium vivax North Korean TaxID=1035514 RepID=A0A0J9U105_PLAVI|nr:hypothetical protein PVNG_06011 [Plasmodium vivax North Korean]
MDVIDKHKNAIGYPYEEKYLDNIMPDLRTQIPNLNKDEDIIKKYFRLLRNDGIFYAGLKNNYCKYINFWLNKEYRDKDYHKKIPKFDFFKTFISKLNYEIHKNNTTTCENYINHLDTERISKIDFLHLLYDAYNKINNLSKSKLNDTCSDIALLDKNYNTSIYDYYVSDKNLFNKIERIKGLILGIKEKYKSPCTNSLYFSTPQKLIDLQEKEALEARLEELRKQKEEAERRESEEQLKRSKSPRDSLFLQEHTPEGRIRYKIEENEPLGEESYAQNDEFQVILLTFSDLLNQHLFLVYLEEEDESIKFLVVLEDFHMEISQIFINMVVGMSDIVQWICLFRGNRTCCVISS